VKKLWITGETFVEHELCLCGLPGTKLGDIKEVLSHGHILETCSRYLSTKFKDVIRTTTWDTAGSCALVKERNNKQTAAIASLEAAEFHSLEVLDKEVGDFKKIITRYIIVQKKKFEDFSQNKGLSLKCSIAVAVLNQPNSLFKLLSCFAFQDMNVSKIDTRPASSIMKVFAQGKEPSWNPWDYLFYIDFTTEKGSDAINEVLSSARKFSISLREFGYYPQFIEDVSLQKQKSEQEVLPWTAYL